MKIRTDFITNSSSSSFIIGFKNKYTIKEELATVFSEPYLSMIYESIADKPPLTNEELKQIYTEEESYDIAHDLYENIFKTRWHEEGQDIIRFWDWIETDEAKRIIQEKADEYYKDLEKEIDKYGYGAIVEVEIGDCDSLEWGNIEHNLMPKFENTIVRFSHH